MCFDTKPRTAIGSKILPKLRGSVDGVAPVHVRPLQEQHPPHVDPKSRDGVLWRRRIPLVGEDRAATGQRPSQRVGGVVKDPQNIFYLGPWRWGEGYMRGTRGVREGYGMAMSGWRCGDGDGDGDGDEV